MMSTVLLLACILSAFTVSFCDWHHPHYSFRCLEDGSVDLYGLHVGSILKLENKPSNCTKFSTPYRVDEHLEPVKIPYECLGKDTGYSKVKITVDDPDFDKIILPGRKRRALNSSTTASPIATTTSSSKAATKSSPTATTTSSPTAATTSSPKAATTSSPTAATSSPTVATSSTALAANLSSKAENLGTSTPKKYIGGRDTHTFIIICRDIPPEGINKTVAHVFKETESNKLPENYKEVDGVEMRFKAVNNAKAPDISSIYVGDEFYMFIKYMGKTKYSLVPRKCDAIQGTTVPKDLNLKNGNSVVLWDYVPSNGDCVQHSELLEQFDRFNSSLVYTKMYGFRFSDNRYITITCDVTLYPPGANKNGTCVPSTSRRKRSIELNTHHVFKRIQVFDSKNSYQSENNSQCNHCGLSVWIVAFITTTLFRRWL